MSDIFGMHGFESAEDLSHEVLDVSHRQRRPRLISLSKLILKTALAVLHDNVLNEPLFLIE